MPNGFVSYCRAEVAYDGRASSRLAAGDYLIVWKPDKCLSVHGALSIKPLNYQNAGSALRTLRSGGEFDDMWRNLFTARPLSIMCASNRGERLAVAVYAEHWRQEAPGWSSSKIDLVRSERDLVRQIMDNLHRYFPGLDVVAAEEEARTPFGQVDILLVDSAGTRHVVEVKRRVASVAACGQAARYGSYYRSMGMGVREVLMAPSISKNAVRYAMANGQSWVSADFGECG